MGAAASALAAWPLPLLAAALAAAAALIWLVGTRLVVYAEAIADRTGLDRVLVGALLLAGATSLPEVATSVSAALIGNAELAVSNLMGGIAMQTAILAAADLFFVGGALTFFAPRPVLVLGGVLLVLQIALAVSAMASGELWAAGHVGAWPLLLFAVYLASLHFMHRFGGRERWIPADLPDDHLGGKVAEAERRPLPKSLWAAFGVAAALVFAGGAGLSLGAESLVQRLHLDDSFVGATVLAIATSLPEVSTTMAAVRRRAYATAVSNIFGSNAIMIALLLPVDVAYRGGPIFDAMGRGAMFLAGLGIVVTALYLWGILERRDRTILRMGVDSLLVLGAYAGGMAVLWAM